jgi:hypothetical protein
MRKTSNMTRWLQAPVLTKRRMVFAMTVAVITDGIQLALGPAGGLFADQILDIIAMLLTCAALGFHPLLLPTFIIELLPFVDMIPTWTGCVGAVLLLRKRAQPQAPPYIEPTIVVPSADPPGLPPPPLTGPKKP